MAEESRLVIAIDSRRAERNLRNVRTELQGVERTGAASMSSLRSAALAATGALAAIGVSAGIGNAVREIAAFQASINGLAAVSNATEQQMASLQNQARTLGATSQFSAQQAAEGQRFLAQAGFEVNEILGSTPGILQLATAAELDLARAADIASNVLGGMGLEVEELGRVNDVLAATASRSNTNIEQLGQALSFAAPFARSAGISIEEAAAAIGVMSDSGIQASRAGTGLLGTIRQLSNVTSAGEEVLSRYGLGISDVNIEARGLQPVLETLRGANLSSAEAIKLFGSEAGAAAQVLVNDYQGGITGATGEAERMASQIQQGLAPAFRSLGSAISEATLQLGDSGLAGGLESVVRGATGVISVFNGMTSEFQEANGVSDDYIGTVESIATTAQLAATAVGVRLATAVGTATTAKISDTAASINNARAEANAAQQVTRRTGAELASARALLRTAQLEVSATRNTNAHAFALQSLSAARIRATNAAGAHATATTAATAAMGRASVAARGLAGAMALVGGPVGLLVGGAGLLYMFRDELGLIPEPTKNAREEIELLTGALEDMNGANIDAAMITINAQMFELERRARETREALEAVNDRNNTPGPFRNSMAQGAGADERRSLLEDMTAINAQRSALTGRQDELLALREGLDKAGESGSKTGDSLDRLGKTADDLVEKFKPMLNEDVESILDRAGEGSTIDENGTLRDAWGNALPTLQRELDAQLKEQINAFRSEQNLQTGLQAAAQAFITEAESAAKDAFAGLMPTGDQDEAPGLASADKKGSLNSIIPMSAEEVARRQAGDGDPPKLMATKSQSSAPERAGKPMGTFTIRVQKEGEGDTEGTVQGDEDFIMRMASALGGVASAV